MKTIGDRIKQIREALGLTGEEFGKKLNVTKVAVSNWENNNRKPDGEMLVRIANIGNVTVDYLLCRTDIKNYADNLFPGPGKLIEEYNPKLTDKDEKNIEKDIEALKEKLQTSEGLMLSGEPATPEAIQSILDTMKIGMELAKQKNKEKYTPKKYRKDKNEG